MRKRIKTLTAQSTQELPVKGAGDRADDPCKAILLAGVRQLIIRTGTKQKIKHLRVVVVVVGTSYLLQLQFVIAVSQFLVHNPLINLVLCM